MNQRKMGLATTVACVAIGLLINSAVSAAVLYQTEFDSAPFVPGPFTNQDGWTGFGTPGSTIQNDTFLSFNQSVKYDAGASSTGQSARLRPVQYSPGSGDDHIVIYEVDALLTGSGINSDWSFQFFGQSGGGRGGFNVLSSGAIQLVTPGVPQLPAGIITRGQWQRWAVAVDVAAETFDVYIDGVLRASGQPFVASIDNVFGAAGFGIFAGTTTTEVGYFDNFRITTAVPEPMGSMAAAFFATALLLRTRNRR